MGGEIVTWGVTISCLLLKWATAAVRSLLYAIIAAMAVTMSATLVTADKGFDKILGLPILAL
jgi:predicted nucleic acid-binding protein